jgi:hypothetical protein
LLPREDDLAVELGVSRTSIREAVKVLSAKGLLQARQRVGVRVRDRDDWNLLDPQVLSWHPDVGHDEALITSLIEARRIIEPAAAALAAKRATAADLARIEQAYLGMERNLRTNLEACCDADLKFHVGVIAASHNIVLKGLTGTIEPALRGPSPSPIGWPPLNLARSPRTGRCSNASGCATPRERGSRPSNCSKSPRAISTANGPEPLPRRVWSSDERLTPERRRRPTRLRPTPGQGRASGAADGTGRSPPWPPAAQGSSNRWPPDRRAGYGRRRDA